MRDKFPPGVSDALKSYVYRLVDPRDGTTFYVGKGVGNRVFAHANNVLTSADGEDEDDLKSTTIREIIAERLEVIPLIHRHGLDSKAALLVEAALIDAYPGLANLVGGHGSDEFGIVHVEQAIAAYEARELVAQHRLMLISINRAIKQRSIYDAVRYAWKVDVERARRAEFVLAHSGQVVRGVFVADEWKPAAGNFPGISPQSKRWGFDGHEAEDPIKRLYVGRRVPPLPRGAANPVRYLDPKS